jgi:hypothetical protein
LKNNGDDIRLYLEPKMPLISADEPLPPRGDMHEYFAPASRLVIINIVLCGVGCVCFGELVKAIIVAPL